MPNQLSVSRRTRAGIATATAALLLTGCASLQPEALRTAEILETTRADQQALTRDVEPLRGELSLEEAIARAIKYNGERRLRLMEEAVASGTFEAGNFDMLPKLVASAGYRDRDNDLISRSKDSVTGAPSLANPFISSSRHATSTDLGFSWSLLDFGQSYYAAKQNADRVLVANERRRKALHTLIQDVRTAFWRAASAQKLSASLRATIAEAEEALKDARLAENERLRSPLEPLRYQRQVLENLRLLETVEQELSTARIELASLANLPLAQNLRVSEPGVGLNTVWLDIPVAKMEEHAILSNADLREGIYNARIARLETHRAMLKLFPGLSFNYTTKTSDDPYLINQAWNETGAQISLNLLGLLSAPAQMRLANAGVALADQKRMTTQMAVLTQLHIARLQYSNAAHQFERADAIASVDSRIAEHVANQEMAAKQTKLDRVAQQTASILSQLRRYQALSNAEAAAAKLQATLGLEPVIGAREDVPLADLRAAVAKSMEAWNTGSASLLSAPDAEAASPPEQRSAASVESVSVAQVPRAVEVAVSPVAAPIAKPAASQADSATELVAAEVNAWAKAWSERDADAYFAYYADAFNPGRGMERDAWVKARRAAMERVGEIRVEVANLATATLEDGRVLARFEQRFVSSRFRETVRKQIVWIKADGKWRIVQETAVRPKRA